MRVCGVGAKHRGCAGGDRDKKHESTEGGENLHVGFDAGEQAIQLAFGDLALSG